MGFKTNTNIKSKLIKKNKRYKLKYDGLNS
jgi:hypothetical protein